MCTILTFTSAIWNDNYADLIDRLYDDEMFNGDGIAMLFDNQTFIQTMDLNCAVDILTSTSWDRVWIHFRSATSPEVGINYNHGFYTKDRQYLVMHNGYIPEGVHLPVDSMWICDLIDTLGIDDAVEHLLCKQSFCNTFIVEVDSGNYWTVRCQSGSLYTDGHGNYSTKKVGPICQEQPVRSFEEHIVRKPTKSVLVPLAKTETSTVQDVLAVDEWDYASGRDDFDYDDNGLDAFYTRRYYADRQSGG